MVTGSTATRTTHRTGAFIPPKSSRIGDGGGGAAASNDVPCTRHARRLESTDRADIADLMVRAAGGDQAAWEGLVRQHARLLWTVARSVGLSGADAADVCQTTWLQLVKHLHAIQEPERVGAWLVTTARREAIRASRSIRDLPAGDDPVLTDGTEDFIDLTDAATAADERALRCLRSSLAALPERSQLLLALLAADPAPSYAEISEALHIPIGSIGPTRARALRQVRLSLISSNVSLDDILPSVV
jgi:RNA polymerase sigma factor (sigma-70 family)